MAAERPKEIPYRWTAQDAAGMAQTPAKIANPYGINPDEVFVATGKAPPADKRWASSFADGDLVSLPTSKCRIPSMLEQFFVAGYAWEEVPKDLQASTLGELCQKLADRSDRHAVFADFSTKAPAPSTPEGKRTVAERKNLIAKKLFWYWGNTDYRWAVLHSGVSLTTIDEAPEALPTQATGKAGSVEINRSIRFVLARHEEQPAVGVAPNAPGGSGEKKSTTIRVPKNLKKDVRDPYKDLDGDLLETVARSFWDRKVALPDTQWNLMYGFGGDPKTPWDALDRLGHMAVNLLVRVFDRTKDIDPTKAVWRQIKYIRNQWWGGSARMKVVYYSPAGMRAALDALVLNGKEHSVARDTYMGAMEHQSRPMKELAAELALDSTKALGDPPDCDTWREVWKLGEESMHFCVGKQDIKRPTSLNPLDYGPRPVGPDDIHIDWISPVSGVDPSTGRCTYSITVSWDHWWQATHGQGAPLFTFAAIDDNLPTATEWALKNGDPSTRAALDDFAKRWKENAMPLAVQGKAGYDKSKAYYKEFVDLYVKLRRETAALGAEEKLMRALSDRTRTQPVAPGGG